MSKVYNVAVIGGGPAGYVAAIKAAQLGGSVVLFEKDVLGGTCLNRGCIPTKCYLKTAEILSEIARGGERGILLSEKPAVDMEKVVAHKNGVVKKLTDGIYGLLRSNRVEVVYGTAALSDERHIACNGKIFEFESAILCGGSKPGRVPIAGAEHENVLTSDGLLNLTEVPYRLAIIGGGVIGCEMAEAFHGFGSKVTIVEAMDRLVPNMDAGLSGQMEKALQKRGVGVLVSKRVKEIRHGKDGSAVVCESGERIEADKVLICVGRSADLECLGALSGKIKQERGKITVDGQMRTSVPNLYAPGDINGRQMLAHAAFKMGETAAINAMGGQETCDLRFVPSCVYTLSEASGVGLTEAEATLKFGKEGILCGVYHFASNGRALASGKGEGFVKVIVEKQYKELLGVHIFGGDAAEMISEATALLHAQLPADEIADMIHPHPTYSEAFMEACAAALGWCIHLPSKK